MADEAKLIRAERELRELRTTIQNLRDHDWQVRLKACSDLAKQRKSKELIAEAVPALIEASRDSNEYVRRAAIPALGDIGPEARQSVPALVGLLSDDEDVQIARSAVYALGKIGPSASAAVEPLIERLRSDDDEIQKAVAWALGVIGAEAVPKIASGVDDSDPRVRAGCVFALGSIGSNAIQALPKLVSSLNDDVANVRYNAAKAIGNLRAAKETETTVVPLSACLEDSDPDVRWAAAEALRKIGTDEAIAVWQQFEDEPSVVDLLKQLFNEDKAVRIDASESILRLMKKEDALHLAKLMEALGDQVWKVRANVCDAIAKTGEGANEAVDALRKSLKDEHEEVRAAAARTLGKIGEGAEAAVPRLIKALKDEVKEVRLAAGLALERIGGKESEKALKKFKWE